VENALLIAVTNYASVNEDCVLVKANTGALKYIVLEA